jgi:hypothetical protein
MMTACDAPLKGVKLLTASPLAPVKNPLLLAINEPSAAKVFRVNTDLVAFFTQLGWACKGKKEIRQRGKITNTRLNTIL